MNNESVITKAAKAGGLFRLGIYCTNSRVILEAQKRITAKKEKEKREKQTNMEDRAQLAIHCYDEWSKDKKFESDGRTPKFAKADIPKMFVRLLVPRMIDPNEKVSSFNTGKKAIGRLLKMADWEAEFEAFKTYWEAEKIRRVKALVKTTPRLF